MSSTDYSEFLSQFGGTLVKPSDDRSTSTLSDALAGKKFVMLYFSAHWCPPCRQFTPKLITLYEKLQTDSKSVELVFCSLDKSKEEYDEYTSDMPWLCMPFDATESKKMARKYKVDGIPHLVVVDGVSGEVITENGTEEVKMDADGKQFPWMPKSLNEILQTDSKSLELAFCSLDKSKEEYDEFTSDMPLLSMPFDATESKKIASKYKVDGIPHLVVVDGVNGEVITENGTEEVEMDADGKKIPWMPESLKEIRSDGIQRHATG